VDRYQKSGRPDANHPLSLLEDIVMCYAWLGLRDEAVTLCKKYVDITKKWPEYVFSRDGGRHSWVEELLSYPDSEEQLRKIFAEQLVFHKLQELPVSDLTK
jgi:hypothetical protein